MCKMKEAVLITEENKAKDCGEITVGYCLKCIH